MQFKLRYIQYIVIEDMTMTINLQYIVQVKAQTIGQAWPAWLISVNYLISPHKLVSDTNCSSGVTENVDINNKW